MQLAAVDPRIALVERLVEFRHDPYGYVLFAFPWGEPGTELARVRGPRKWQRRKLERIGRKLAIDVLRRGTLRTFEVTPLERPAARAA